MIVVPFLPCHLDGFEPQDSQGDVLKYLEGPDYADLLSNAGPAYSGIESNSCIACAGVMPITEFRAVAWALLSKHVGAHNIIPITREIRKFMADSFYKRIETPVRRDFENGHRWAKLLGFKNETPGGMEYYGADGLTYDLYARIKK